MENMRKVIILIVLIIVLTGVWNGLKVYSPELGTLLHRSAITIPQDSQQVKVVSEENVTISDVKKVGPSVVTVIEQAAPSSGQQSFDLGPFGFFSPQQTQPLDQPQSIGSGFIITNDGMIVTNKHVVSDATGKYQVITSNDKKYDVQKVYRDPSNDLAIIKIDPNQNSGNTLQPVSMGDSSKLQVGQFVVAIGTALGEFRNSVTTGVVSGLGRGITAGDEFAGAVERLDNVIQTSAAINPGNSGGPLLDSVGHVIGINTAVAQNGQNVGFALPINTVKDSLANFNQNGQFTRPYLGVAYKIISRDSALLNDVPQGAYIQQVVSGSPAEKAGIQQGDIMTKVDGQQITQQSDVASIISKKKVNDTISITIWRDGKTRDMQVTLENTPNQ
ncbi:MAG TPA: trypsin-like peptidase domain-containing protein [Candidatus Saccharimonadales bacterium]|nr:trypsin-like peptidase domain-containing protein [Candidatus Saccharimonadales bacterium]